MLAYYQYGVGSRPAL